MTILATYRFRFRHLAVAALAAVLLHSSWVSLTGWLAGSYVETMSVVLAGRVVVIDPGHGGKDSGSRSPGGTLEKDITLEVSRRLAVILRQAGATVVMTRESDTWLADPSAPHKKRSDLTRRVEIANENNADVFISIHVNSFMHDRRQKGAQTFSQPGSEEGRELSASIQSELARILGNTERKPKEIDYFIRRSEVPAVIVEIGFISNPGEEKLLLEGAYQSKIAMAIYGGLVHYFSKQADGVKKEK